MHTNATRAPRLTHVERAAFADTLPSGGPDGGARPAAEVLVLEYELARDEGRTLRVGEDGYPNPRGIEWRDDHLAAELGGRLGGGVGVGDRERHAPMRRDIGLVVRDRVDARHDVLESHRSAYLGHPLAELGVVALEVVAVAGHGPHLGAACRQRLPAE